ncbi:pyridoxal phosphate-dependent transferase [Dactylonectria macrodidyma]|uniref:aromatic-amino-acid transaminase n=1 Tax=Dactylonectria macrodidyma TaxID=307937 RepID=A0A9P9IQN4_9HYPO|nr:pyridoxal phosphate-dependent transferase [Dactylonectria macrodidyma]
MTYTSSLQPRRSDVHPKQWGVAAPCSSESFKTQDSSSKPQALKWDHRLSIESTSRTGSSLKNAFKYLQNPGMLSLGGGIPLSEYFPFENVGFDAKVLPASGDSTPTTPASAVLRTGKNDLSDGHSVFDLSVALNYGQGSGSAQLLRWITEHTEMVHNPPYADWQCTMTIGNTSAMDMALRMFARSGDFVLSDNYTFVAAVETAKPMGVNFLGVEMDEQGIVPSKLKELLDGWKPEEHSGSRKPFLLYLVPTGQNPTGSTQSLERRQSIYQVAQEHDLIILEDDPYYFLQMDSPSATIDSVQTPEDLLRAIVPSYVRIDTDGRVVRMDSFSKVVSPGLRLGWITASEQIVNRYKTHADVSTQGPSGLSQLGLFKLLDEHWGHSGYLSWLLHLRREYTQRRDNALEACSRYLPKDVASWEVPEAGMFIWVKVDWEKHPLAASRTATEIEEEIWTKTIDQGALVARGSWFFATAGKACSEVFYRLTFAASSMEQVNEATKRFGEALSASFQLKAEASERPMQRL